ncbi:MAG: hypothetical protein ACK4GL_07700 [Flavobacteriales bacterium]
MFPDSTKRTVVAEWGDLMVGGVMDFKFNLTSKRFKAKHRSYYGAHQEKAFWYLRMKFSLLPLGFREDFGWLGSSSFIHFGLGGYFHPITRKIYGQPINIWE